MKKVITLTFLILSTCGYAEWHSGEIEMIAIGYDGKTISIGQKSSTKTDCTCYPTWPNRYCLDSSRETFDKEYALLLSAKARNKSVGIHIDETSCKIVAMLEN